MVNGTVDHLRRQGRRHEQRKEVSLVSLSAVWWSLLSDRLENVPCGLPYINSFPGFPQVNFSQTTVTRYHWGGGWTFLDGMCHVSRARVVCASTHGRFGAVALCGGNLVSKNMSRSIRRGNNPGLVLSWVTVSIKLSVREPRIPCAPLASFHPPNKKCGANVRVNVAQ